MRTNPTLAVFTPTYNRAYTLWKGYEGLKRQTSKDFKWVIVDDGSTDNTRELVEGWMKEKQVPIEYYYKKHGGMHTAHNEAYRHIDTELAVCIDSDDYMTDDAVELIIDRWRKYGDDRFAGMIGLDVFENGSVIGTSFPEGLTACKTYDMKRKYGVTYDKKYVYRPEVIKKYLPYPEVEGETYGFVNWLYQKIDHDYDMLCSNDAYCVVKYMPDGLSVHIYEQHKKSPRTRVVESDELITYVPYKAEKGKRAIQYVSSAIFAKDLSLLFKSSNKKWVLSMIPLGIAYNCYLRFKKTRKLYFVPEDKG